MRGSWFWLALIGLASAAILAGYISGARTQPPAVVQLHPNARSTSVPVRVAVVGNERRMFSGGSVVDLFSDDDVVADRSAPTLADWHAPRLSIVVGLCGRSAALETQFLTLGIPLAFDVDPNGGEAAKLANEVRASGAVVIAHFDRAPSSRDLASVRTRIGDYAGIGTRDALAALKPLQGTGLFVFDERGTTDARLFVASGVPLVSRDVVADNREERGYVGYMLERAVDRSFHSGQAVVLVRPLPTTLEALRAFAADRNVEFSSIR